MLSASLNYSHLHYTIFDLLFSKNLPKIAILHVACNTAKKNQYCLDTYTFFGKPL